jgi:hypothetical protein
VKTTAAAEILGDSPRQVRELVRRGVLTGVRFTEGGHLHIRVDDRLALIDKGDNEDA